MGDSTYNGWSNYPTWAVSLWLGSDQGTAQEVERLAQHWERDTRDGGTVSELADTLRAFVEDFPEIEAVQGEASLAADLLGLALDLVDWQQIAETHAADVIGGDTDDAHAEMARRRRVFLDRASAQIGGER
jgi:hypothetical protein